MDKYKPQSLSEIVGNPSLVNALFEWLQNWHSCHLRHEMIPEAPASRSKTNGDANTKKAVLLNGPPGIGKTTTALLVTKYVAHCAQSPFYDDVTSYREAGFDAIEVNASDTRNRADKIGKGGIAGKRSNQIKALCQNTSVLHPSTTEESSMVLIMDEVDGMSGKSR